MNLFVWHNLICRFIKNMLHIKDISTIFQQIPGRVRFSFPLKKIYNSKIENFIYGNKYSRYRKRFHFRITHSWGKANT